MCEPSYLAREIDREIGPSAPLICADIPLDPSRYALDSLIEAFAGLVARVPDVSFALAGRRDRHSDFSGLRKARSRGLTERFRYLPYYDQCERFPCKKRDATVWIDRSVALEAFTLDQLASAIQNSDPQRRRIALFFTCFHPAKNEGNSVTMRYWLDDLRQKGYEIHLVYYAYDRQAVTDEMIAWGWSNFDLYREIAITSSLVGHNRNGLNVHVDDWCGIEALDAVSELVRDYEYDVAVVQYAFMSAVFDRVAAYTTKILCAHDSFTDRNRHMLAQGFRESSWVSLDRRGERDGCLRADIVAVQSESDTADLRDLMGAVDRVQFVPTVFPIRSLQPKEGSERLRIGFFGSSNWVNEHNLIDYLNAWLSNPILRERSEILVAGGVSRTLPNFASEALLGDVRPKLLGALESLDDFFEACDIFINPERGGTGIKIKALETMAVGAGILCTEAGASGLGVTSRFHRAADAAALAELTAEVCLDRSLIDEVRLESVKAYKRYADRIDQSLDALF